MPRPEGMRRHWLPALRYRDPPKTAQEGAKAADVAPDEGEIPGLDDDSEDGQ
jgi:hypothetical protein